MLAQARRGAEAIALWPFDGALAELLDGSDLMIAAETYPREFYPRLQPAGAPARRWSKRRRDDRLLLMPGLLTWARTLGVTWDGEVLARVRSGLSAGPNGEDEFDAVVGVLGMIAVASGTISPGEPRDDAAVTSTEGWILGRSPAGVKVSKSG
jgi:hypothetical protein